MEGFVKKKVDKKGVATITFFHPKSNSLPGNLLNRLAEHILAASTDTCVKLIVLNSEGDRAFCAGASFDELIGISDLAEGKHFFMGFAKVINAIRKSDKLVICRAHNKAVGGGVGIVCASDYAVGTVDASLRLSELNVGIGPFVIGPVVERKIGKALYTKLALEANWVSAAWARDKGIFAKIFPTIAEVDTYLDGFIEHMLSKNPEAVAEIKKISWQGFEKLDALLCQRAEISGNLVLSDFTKTFIKRFKSK